MAAMVLVSAFVSSGVSAIGITPGRTTIDFEPGLEKDVHFTVINNERKDMDMVLYVKEGPLSDSITMYDNVVTFRSDEESKGFRYSVKLPQSISEPGTHEVDVMAMEMPGKDKEGTFVGATTAVATQLLIRVPYPGKYAKLELAVREAQPGEPVDFFLSVINLGTQDILRAKADIDILGPTNEKLATITTAEEGVDAKSTKEFKATWNANANPGVYHAVVTLRYDADIGGGVAVLDKNFVIGNLYIDLKSITVKDFRLGSVAKFNIIVESKWNQDIKDAYGNLVIEDEAGNTVADVKTASVDVAPLERKEMYAYWDTEGVKAGDYKARFILHYAGRTSEKELVAHVEVSQIRVDIVGLGIGAVTAEPAAGTGMETMIMLLVMVLVGINAGWFMYFKKRR